MASRRPRVYVPEPLPDSALAKLRSVADIRQGPSDRACSQEELIAAARDSDALVITSRDQITRHVIESAPLLKVITKAGAKPNNVDFGAAKTQGTLVTWTPGANAVSVAEFTIMLMLTLAKRVIEHRTNLRGGGWRTYDHLGVELDGKSAGLIGLGAIGIEVARRLQTFGIRIIAYDPGVPAAAMACNGVIQASLDDVVCEADFLSLHCELNGDTRHIIGEKQLRAMKPSAVVVNTARGGLINEAALVRALEEGWIAAAGLDVFAEEPLGSGARLLQLTNVVATPHVAAFTQEAVRRETHWAVEDVAAVLSGRQPLHWRAPVATG